MAKIAAKGVLVKYAATATPTTAVVNKAEVGFEDGDRELIDSTTHENTTTKSYLDSGLRDTLGLSLRLLLDPADTIHELMRAHWSAGTLGYMTVILPDAGAAQFDMSGYITSFQIEGMTPKNELAVRIKFKAATVETYAQ